MLSVPFRHLLLLRVRGNITVTNVRVYDGDTIKVDVEGWPDVVGKNIGVRIAGIDAPEMHDKDDRVRAWAIAARNHLNAEMIGRRVELASIRRDKYFRILAQVLVNGRDVATDMLQHRYAKPYAGGTKTPWLASDVSG